MFFDVSYTGFARIALRNKTAKVPGDLRGLKIRGTGTYIDIIKSYGAAAVTIDTPQVYGALERGLIDGAVGLNTNWINFKWAEPATYLVDVNLAPVGATLAVSKTAWNKLSARDQKLFRVYAQMQAAELTNQYLREEISGNNIIGRKLTIYQPTAAEKKQWNALRGEAVEAWTKVVGAEVSAKAMAIVEKYNQ